MSFYNRRGLGSVDERCGKLASMVDAQLLKRMCKTYSRESEWK